MDQNDNQPEKSNDDSSGTGRSYDCTFCKRGFTNAQALGGHMNIHRKDKAKSSKPKHKINQEEASHTSNENLPNPRYAPPISSVDHDHQQMSYGGHLSYQLFLPSPNPNLQTGNYVPVWKTDPLDSGLSLRIGRSPPDVRDEEGGSVDTNVKENEVDLELRLGHDP